MVVAGMAQAGFVVGGTGLLEKRHSSDRTMTRTSLLLVRRHPARFQAVSNIRIISGDTP
jgi:hypothetical protein